jgi:phage gp36-like protein
MAYSTQTDILKMISQEQLAQLTAEVGSSPDASVVSEAIAHADGEIDSYLAVRYVLPISPTPARVKTLSVAFALYYLFSRRPNLGMPETVRNNYKDGVQFLRDVAGGRAEIPDSSGAEISGDATEVSEITSKTRVFDRDGMEGW